MAARLLAATRARWGAGLAGLAAGGAGIAAATTRTASSDAAGAGVLDAKAWGPFRVLTHNTWKLSFALADPGSPASLPVASCLLARLPVGTDGKQVIRPYTPVNKPGDKGTIELVVKAYPGGGLSPHLAGLAPGDTADLKGPIPKIGYERNKWGHVGMVAGGTGITPMLQVLYAGLVDASDRTKFTLVYGSLSPEDIILKPELDALAARHPGRLSVHYLVDAAPQGTPKGTAVGRVSPGLLKSALPAPGAGGMVFVCGPPGLMEAVSGGKAKDKTQGELTGMLKAMGYAADEVFKF